VVNSPPRADLRSEYPSVRFDPLGRPSRLQPYAETGPAGRVGGALIAGTARGLAQPGKGALSGRDSGSVQPLRAAVSGGRVSNIVR
jgi:hypothetical protein